MAGNKKTKELTENEVLIYGAYTRVTYALQRSNRAQLTYKGISLTLIIATYIGVGYSPSSFETNLPLNPLLLVSSICIASLLVLGVIWYRDLIVEEKRIAAAVHHGLALEKKYPELLPQVYHTIGKMNTLLGYVSKKSIFYVGFSSILLATIFATLSAYMFINNVNFWMCMPFVFAISIYFMHLTLNKTTNKSNPYKTLDVINNHKGKHGHR